MRLSASLFAADPLRLFEAVAAVSPYVGSLHIDVMDGHFAPAFGFGETIVRRLLTENAPPIDVHLMVQAPETWALRFAMLGVRSVAFHAEATSYPAKLAQSIREHRARAYLALQPEMPISTVLPILPHIDGLLLLTAPAGGGAFSAESLQRVRDVPGPTPVRVDGGLRSEHLALPLMSRVELAVVGAALFSAADVVSAAKQLAHVLAANQPEPAPYGSGT